MKINKIASAVVICAGMAHASVITSGTVTTSLQGYRFQSYNFVDDGLTLVGAGEFDNSFGYITCKGNASTCSASPIAYPFGALYLATNSWAGNGWQYLVYSGISFHADVLQLSASLGTLDYVFPFTAAGSLTVYPWFDLRKDIPLPQCLICDESVAGSGIGTLTIDHEKDVSGEYFIPQSETLVFAPEPSPLMLAAVALALICSRAKPIGKV